MPVYQIRFEHPPGKPAALAVFEAPNDAVALRVGTAVGDASTDVHQGYSLWQGSRRVSLHCGEEFVTRRAKATMPIAAQDIVLDLEFMLLQHNRLIAKSRMLLEATKALGNDVYVVLPRRADRETPPRP